MTCELGAQPNTLLFRFHDIARQDLTNIFFEFTNFINPWSAITIKSIRINTYRSTDCSGSSEGSPKTQQVSFWPKEIPADNSNPLNPNPQLSSSSLILGDSDPNVSLTIGIVPVTIVSKTGRGIIQVEMPLWY
mmetsp:Transcript_22416/g.27591  ORF Transcript_22416/g.27591 Transcript_22416/m.27591 type:complete len:133 (+) Transcript_22416:494-892(+)